MHAYDHEMIQIGLTVVNDVESAKPCYDSENQEARTEYGLVVKSLGIGTMHEIYAFLLMLFAIPQTYDVQLILMVFFAVTDHNAIFCNHQNQNQNSFGLKPEFKRMF